MMKYLKNGLCGQLRYFACTLIPVVLIVVFTGLAGTYWPDYAWGTTAIFTVIIIIALYWLV